MHAVPRVLCAGSFATIASLDVPELQAGGAPISDRALEELVDWLSREYELDSQ